MNQEENRKKTYWRQYKRRDGNPVAIRNNVIYDIIIEGQKKKQYDSQQLKKKISKISRYNYKKKVTIIRMILSQKVWYTLGDFNINNYK